MNSKLINNKKYLKAEKKSYNEKIDTKKMLSMYLYIMILIDSVYIKDKNYPQVFLEENKHVVRKKEVIFYD